MPIPHDFAIFALSLAFFAGIYVSVLRASRKQINGLGGRVNRVDQKHEEANKRMVMALTHICPPDKREELIRIILIGDKNG